MVSGCRNVFSWEQNKKQGKFLASDRRHVFIHYFTICYLTRHGVVMLMTKEKKYFQAKLNLLP